MNGSTRHFYSSCKNCVMNFQSIKTFSTERRDQGWMDIDDLVRICFHHHRRDRNQITCKNDQVYSPLLKFGKQCFMKSLPVRIVFRCNAHRFYIMFSGSFQRISGSIVADHNIHFCICDLSRINGIHDRLKIRSSAGNKNTDL